MAVVDDDKDDDDDIEHHQDNAVLILWLFWLEPNVLRAREVSKAHVIRATWLLPRIRLLMRTFR